MKPNKKQLQVFILPLLSPPTKSGFALDCAKSYLSPTSKLEIHSFAPYKFSQSWVIATDGPHTIIPTITSGPACNLVSHDLFLSAIIPNCNMMGSCFNLKLVLNQKIWKIIENLIQHISIALSHLTTYHVQLTKKIIQDRTYISLNSAPPNSMCMCMHDWKFVQPELQVPRQRKWNIERKVSQQSFIADSNHRDDEKVLRADILLHKV